jgi:hypothetical protein
MALEEKYQKASIDYWLALISRKFYSTLSAYPEFVFVLKILIGIIVAFFVFNILGRFIGH